MKKYTFLKTGLILIAVFLVFSMVKNYFMQPSMGSGEAVKDFSGTLADGSAFNLTDLKGKYVLLDFWGSWCGPCFAEMPHIKEMYGKYSKSTFKNADGFTIVSVAVEKDEKRWRRALERFQMPWQYQIMDQAESLRFFDSPIANLYGVKQLPTKFLIDEKGMIISVDWTVEEIAAFLEGEIGN